MPGQSIAEIVAAFDKPLEFETHGGVFLKRNEFDPGHIVERQYWHLVRPKDDTALFVSLIPQGGGGGDGGKNTFAMVAAIALMALVIFVSAGGLAFMAPAVFSAATFGAGTTGALVAGAAIGLAGSASMALLTKPSAGVVSPFDMGAGGDITAGRQQGAAGVSQNPLTAYKQLWAALGPVRASPPLLARPFTIMENDDQVLNMICGMCGPCDISSIKINEVDISDLPDGVLEYETREGWSDDPVLTLVNRSGFQENINLVMSTHRLDIDQSDLIIPYSGSYPKAHLFRSARNTNEFRITLNFNGGLANYNNANAIAVAFRIRIRLVGYSATSVTSNVVATGAKTFTTQTGLPYLAGQGVRVVSRADSASYMEGTVTSYSGTSLVIDSTEAGWPSTHIDWDINRSWTKLPEIHVNASRREAFRQEIWLHWGTAADEAATYTGGLPALRLFKRSYYKNTEWTADSYFDDGASGTVTSTYKHVYPDADGITFHLDEDSFELGQYDIEITRGFAAAASGYTDTTYTIGLFTYRTLTGTVESIPVQSSISHGVAIESHTSFRDEYPIAARGIAMIAIKARNLQVNSVSAIFGPHVGTWDSSDWNTVAVSSNPAALVRHVLTGDLNARPVPIARMEDTINTLYDYSVSEGLSCHHLVTGGSVEQAATLAASCGDSVLRRSDKWGVVIDKDRTAEPITGMFTPSNMTSPLIITKTFHSGARAVIPHFHDITRDYAERDLDRPVYDDGVPSSETTLTESAPYDGLVTEALAIRRATMDLRKIRMRSIKYSFGTHLAHIKSKKGDIVGLAHDVLVDTYGTGRVKSYIASGGNLVSVTMNANFADLPVVSYDGLFEVDRVFTLSQFFALGGESIGLQIELPDATVTTINVSGVVGPTLTVDGTVATPSGLKKGCLVAVGRRTRETRRVILANITPKNDLFAQLEAFDEAPEIFTGL